MPNQRRTIYLQTTKQRIGHTFRARISYTAIPQSMEHCYIHKHNKHSGRMESFKTNGYRRHQLLFNGQCSNRKI